MDSSITIANTEAPFFSPTIESTDSIILKSLIENPTDSAAKVDVSIDTLTKALSVSAQEILEKLNAILEERGAKKIESLKSEDHTPEKTAERIVNGATAFFEVYAQQNPNLSGEDLINGFMTEIRSGIDQGYDSAFNTLGDLGAFEFEGVQSGIEETKQLIEERLNLFEETKRKELGLDPTDIKENVSESVLDEILTTSAQNFSIERIA